MLAICLAPMERLDSTGMGIGFVDEAPIKMPSFDVEMRKIEECENQSVNAATGKTDEKVVYCTFSGIRE